MKREDFMDLMMPCILVILIVILGGLIAYVMISASGAVKEQKAAEQHCIDAHNNTCDYYGCMAALNEGGEYAISMRLAEQNCLLREE